MLYHCFTTLSTTDITGGAMTEQELYDYAVTLLAKRDYSSGDLRYQLKRFAYESAVEPVMEKLLSHHYLDDTRLIEKELHKQLGKLHGESRIKQDLRKKGLDALLIAQSLEDLDVDWYELCQQAKDKKFGSKRPQDAKEKAQMIRYLQYRGHSIGIIMESISV